MPFKNYWLLITHLSYFVQLFNLDLFYLIKPETNLSSFVYLLKLNSYIFLFFLTVLRGFFKSLFFNIFRKLALSGGKSAMHLISSWGDAVLLTLGQVIVDVIQFSHNVFGEQIIYLTET